MDPEIVCDGRTLRVEARFKNARLYNAIASHQVITTTSARIAALQRGRPIKSFCDMYDINVTAVYELLNLHAGPLTPSGRAIRLVCQRLANLLECEVAWLFPEALYRIKWPKYLAVDTDIEHFVGLKGIRAEFLLPPSQQEDQEHRELREQLDIALRTLSPREEKILVERFGLRDQEEQDVNSVANKYNVSGQRIRQIEAKALRKLRHPNRSLALLPHL